MSYLEPGRPQKFTYTTSALLPHESGIYRIRTKENGYKYIGLSNDVNRRIKEHKKHEVFLETDVVEFLNLKPLDDSDEIVKALKEAERAQIKKHHPTNNKSTGGEGPVAKTFCINGVIIESSQTTQENGDKKESVDIPVTENTWKECSEKISKAVWIRRIIFLIVVALITFVLFKYPGVRNFVWNVVNRYIIPGIQEGLKFINGMFERITSSRSS